MKKWIVITVVFALLAGATAAFAAPKSTPGSAKVESGDEVGEDGLIRPKGIW